MFAPSLLDSIGGPRRARGPFIKKENIRKQRGEERGEDGRKNPLIKISETVIPRKATEFVVTGTNPGRQLPCRIAQRNSWLPNRVVSLSEKYRKISKIKHTTIQLL